MSTGLLQRFQLLVYSDKKTWKLVDESPNPFAKGRVFHICKTIDTLKFTDCGAKESEPLYEGQYIIPYFRFSPEAQTFFHDWIKKLQEKLEGRDHPILIQHLSKYRSLMLSLSLIYHLINVFDGLVKGDIPLSSVEKLPPAVHISNPMQGAFTEWRWNQRLMLGLQSQKQTNCWLG